MVRDDPMDRLVRVGDLIGVVEISQRWGVTPQAASNLLLRYEEQGKIAPVRYLGQSRIYLWPEVEEFRLWHASHNHNWGGKRQGNGASRHTIAEDRPRCRKPGCSNVQFRKGPFCQACTYDYDRRTNASHG